MSAQFDAPRETLERLCPQCGSLDIHGLGRIVATSAGVVRTEHGCQACAATFWLYPDRRHGPRDRRAPSGTAVLQRRTPTMTNTQQWHSNVATDRPLYHDDTRCHEGQAIALKDRRPGDGGRDPCPHCMLLLVATIRARFSPSGRQT